MVVADIANGLMFLVAGLVIGSGSTLVFAVIGVRRLLRRIERELDEPGVVSGG